MVGAAHAAAVLGLGLASGSEWWFCLILAWMAGFGQRRAQALISVASRAQGRVVRVETQVG